MAQPEFIYPDFIENNSPEEIHARMMGSLPDDIDDMPGGFPYDFTMPAALEKAELINYHLVRSLMIAFPQYAWDGWLDLHGQQVGLTRHQAEHAGGYITVEGKPGAEIPAGTVFCVPSVDGVPATEYGTTESCSIGEDGKATVGVAALASGTGSNVPAHSISVMARSDRNIVSVTNPEPVKGGKERESNDDYYDRIAAEYDSSMTYLGNDSNYIRWAKKAGAGDCIVMPAANGPGTVTLVLVDANGRPADQALVETVYDYIVSPDDRNARLLPTACAELSCVAATTVRISFACTGLLYDGTTDIGQIKAEFMEAVKTVYAQAKDRGMLRYNAVRPLISEIPGVKDFDTFLMNGGMGNIEFGKEEYPETGAVDFS